MAQQQDLEQKFDVIIIGSGFGGSMAAWPLVNSGLNVLMVERGGWVDRGPHNWDMNAAFHLSPHYSRESPIQVHQAGKSNTMGTLDCIGGPSVYYGGVSLRFREKDFHSPAEIVADSGAKWPVSYQDMERYYSSAEQLLNVAGESGTDPTEPFRSIPYPQKPPPIADISQRIKAAAKRLQLHPSHLPLAINYSDDPDQDRSACISCTTCDTYACAIKAKNDLASTQIPRLMKRGMSLLAETIVTRLTAKNDRITGIHVINRHSGVKKVLRANQVVLSAGALGSPHLLLASGLQQHNPASALVGRYLMRHINAIAFGIFPSVPDRQKRFHKELAILDYYFGDPDQPSGLSKLGSIQQFQTPPEGLVRDFLPTPLGMMVAPALKFLTGLLNIAEDQPQHNNFVSIDPLKQDRFGLPQMIINHRYSQRDYQAVNTLIRKSKKILRAAGAWFYYVHRIETFSHAVGTLRMGSDPRQSVLDPFCRYRGIENLRVIDGSFMPTSGAVNPSLTISANALRCGEHLATDLSGSRPQKTSLPETKPDQQTGPMA